jgi:septation ring formation regulator EzrA
MAETISHSEHLLERIARELKTIREALVQAINHEVEAEGEIPEKMRRFVTYMHDVHDISYMYEERGHAVPQHILREMERCDDRFRQLIKELHLDGGTFEQVRREMAKDPDNRWDHTRLLFDQKETP